MKKLIIMILAVVPFGINAQSSQDVYAVADDIFSKSYADLGSAFTNEKTTSSSGYDVLEVDDMLLADPEFDIQENMISYTKDLQTVYFSANKKLKVKKGKTADVAIKNSVQLQMFKANVNENGEWVNLEMLPFNSKSHSTGHPALSADETKLFFVSDGPESTGKTDIFMVDLFADGTYGKPENLGLKINSQGREVFPMVDASSVLYFASDVDTDGEKMDVFASEIIDNTVSARIKLDVEATGSKEDYTAAFEAIDAEAKMMAEKEADLRDLEILIESERLAEIASIEEAYSEVLTGSAYDFSQNNVMYTVQIGAFLKSVKTGTYTDSSGLFNYNYDDGYNRFYSGVFKSYEEALVHMEQIKKDGHKDAFVLGLKGTERFLPEE